MLVKNGSYLSKQQTGWVLAKAFVWYTNQSTNLPSPIIMRNWGLLCWNDIHVFFPIKTHRIRIHSILFPNSSPWEISHTLNPSISPLRSFSGTSPHSTRILLGDVASAFTPEGPALGTERWNYQCGTISFCDYKVLNVFFLRHIKQV